jgi:hypothetical protein
MLTGGGSQNSISSTIMIPVPIAQYLSNASSTELSFVKALIESQLYLRQGPPPGTMFVNESIVYNGSDGAAEKKNGAWATPLQVATSRSPLFTASQTEVIESFTSKNTTTTAATTPDSTVSSSSPSSPFPEGYNRYKLYVFRPKHSEWDFKQFRMAVLEAMGHGKKFVAKIYCPEEGAGYCTVNFFDSTTDSEENHNLALEAKEALTKAEFKVNFTRLRKKKE